MVDDFEKKRKNTTKTQLLSSFLMVDQCKKVSISKTQGPSTRVLGATSSPKCNHYATSQPEQYRYFLTIKRGKQTNIRKVIKLEQAKRGFAKEASVYFPYLDSVLFCTVHYATLPFHHSAIPPFRNSAIPPFCHSAIPPFRHSAIPSFRHSTIPPFRHSTIPQFCSNTQ